MPKDGALGSSHPPASPCGQFTELLGRLDTWLLHLKAGSNQTPHSFSLFASRTQTSQVRIHVTVGGVSGEALSNEGGFQRWFVNSRASAPHTLLSDGQPNESCFLPSSIPLIGQNKQRGTLGPEGAAVGTPGACCPVHLKPIKHQATLSSEDTGPRGSLAEFRSYAAMPPRKEKLSDSLPGVCCLHGPLNSDCQCSVTVSKPQDKVTTSLADTLRNT